MDSLVASIEELSDGITSITSEIKTLQSNIRTTDMEVALATEQRKKEHQEFVDTLATSDTARRLIDKAANRLAKFYSPKAHAAKEAAKASLLRVKPTLPPTAAAQRMAAAFDSLAQRNVQRRHSTITHRVAPPNIIETPKGPVIKKGGGIL